MRQYWINRNGSQTGPHTLEDLQQMVIDKKTYVWFSGMDDWKRVKDVPELAHLVQEEEVLPEQPVAEPEPINPGPTPVEEPETGEPEVAEEPAEEVQDAEEPVEEISETEEPVEENPEAEEPAEEEIEQASEEPQAIENTLEDELPFAAQPPQYSAPQVPPVQPAYVQQTPQYAPAAVAETEMECPPTYLVWSIIATILCCTLTGIIGIVFATLVKSNWRMGNYKKAQKFSDWSAWMVILSIVLTIFSLPLTILMIH